MSAGLVAVSDNLLSDIQMTHFGKRIQDLGRQFPLDIVVSCFCRGRIVVGALS
jgi:hypothetical protein